MSSLIPKGGRPKERPQTEDASSRQNRSSNPGGTDGFKQVATFALAIAADSLQVAFPTLWIPVSIVAALILFAMWGWRVEILAAFIPELVPGLALIPSWVAIAFFLTKRTPVIALGGESGWSKENETRGPHE